MKGKVLLQGLVLVTCLMMFSATNVLSQDFCQGDFNYNGSVAADDVTVFLENFGRSPFFNPCPPDGPAPISKSGQGASASPGDDGDLETGVAWPNSRFKDNLNGTVTDKLTGLIWLTDANCFGTRTWNDALSDSNGLSNGICGLTDGSTAGEWRLPHIKELQSLLDFSDANPALPSGHPFTNVQSDVYWSSTTYAAGSLNAWYVFMDDCYMDRGTKSYSCFVWPVRGGHVSGGDNTGSPCTQATDCSSGYCVDGVCCNSQCDGLCLSCLASDTGAPDGLCFLITAGTDPYDECVDPETCNGLGSCANP